MSVDIWTTSFIFQNATLLKPTRSSLVPLLHHDLFDSLAEGILLIDEKGKPFYANESLLLLLGMRSRQIQTTKTVSDLFTIESKTDFERMTSLNSEEQASMTEVVFKTKTGSLGRAQITKQVVVDYESKKSIYVFSFRDVELENRLQNKYHNEINAKDKKIKEVSLLLDTVKALRNPNNKLDLIKNVMFLLFQYKIVSEAFFIESSIQNGLQKIHLLTSSEAPHAMLLTKPIDFTDLRSQGPLFLIEPGSEIKKITSRLQNNLSIKSCALFQLDINSTLLGDILLLSESETFLGDSREMDLVQSALSQLKLALESQEFWQRSIIDVMTKIYNRRYFDLQFLNEIDRASRILDQPQSYVGLLILDVDHFKKFNDTYGHQIGDLVLIHLAEILKKSSRPYDVAARYGGEEFVVLLPNTNEQTLRLVAERLRVNIESNPLVLGAQKLSITVSIGGSVYPEHGKTPKQLMINADIALYKSKDHGRNCVTIFAANLEGDKLTEASNSLAGKPALTEHEEILIPKYFRISKKINEPALAEIEQENSSKSYSILASEVASRMDLVNLLTSKKFSSVVQRTQTDLARELRLLIEIHQDLDIEKFLSQVLSSDGLINPDSSSTKIFRLNTSEVSSVKSTSDLTSKDLLLASLRSKLNESGGRNFLHEAVALTFEEYFMNATFDAPQAAAKINQQAQSSSNKESKNDFHQDPTFYFGFSNERLVLACEDNYGSFQPEKFLNKLASSHQYEMIHTVNQGPGGAGIGNRIIFENSSELFLIHEPNRRTIFISTFERTKSMRQYENILKNIFFNFKKND